MINPTSSEPGLEHTQVLIIGAGPAGSLASALLNRQGIEVLVLEKQQFPRFSIGESLLPQLMIFLENAGMLEAVVAAGYQLKNGAAFRKQGRYTEFDFSEKFTQGPGTTFQVKRAEFDKLLADTAEQQGVPIRYQQEVKAVEEFVDHCLLTVEDNKGESYQVKAGFVLDASGYGRVLPRLMDLEYPSDFPERSAMFCHLKDNIDAPDYDRNKILISVHPENNGIWYWLIPFHDGTCSLGVVGAPAFFEGLSGNSEKDMLSCINAEPDLAILLRNAEFITPVQKLKGFAANVRTMYGKRFALLGNAAEFLDPVFSSGVTIAFKSAELACALLARQHRGEVVDWEVDYAEVLMKGINTFRAFVSAWYDGRLQDIIFYTETNNEVREKVCSILAGYAWDETNPYVAKPERRIAVLAELCKEQRREPSP